ncbi:MAG: MFS transporter [Nanoarchaeota archaeon]
MKLNNIHKSYVFNFFNSIFFFGAVTIPFFIDWAELNYTQIFILEAWFSFWVFALEIPTGAIADKFGRKVSLALGGVFGTIGFLIFGLTKNYFLFYVANFILAFGLAFISGANTALLYDSLIDLKKQKQGKYYLSRFNAAGTIGMVLAFPIGSMIAGSNLLEYPNTLPLTFILTAITTAVLIFIALSMKEPKRHQAKGNLLKVGVNGLKHLFKHKVLKVFAINSILISAVTFFIFWLYQPLLGEIGINISYYGFIAAGYNIFASFLMLNIKSLERILGMKNILFYTAIIPGLFFIGVTLLKNVVFVLISIFLITGSKILRAPILSDFMNKHIKSKNRATVLSAVSMFERVVIALLYPLIGILADISLNYALIFLGGVTLVFTFITRIESIHII